MTDVPPPSTPTGPVYGPSFGTQGPSAQPSDPAYPGAIPERAQTPPPPPPGAFPPGTPSGPDQTPPGGRASRTRNLVLAGGLALVTLVLIGWFLVSLRGGDNEPQAKPSPSDSATSSTPTSSATPTPSSSRSTSASPGPSRSTSGDRPLMSSPPTVKVSSVPVANIPPGAKSVRLEVHSSQAVDITIGDSQHRSLVVPGQTSPYAVEFPAGDVVNLDYLSIGGRIPYGNSGKREDVMCRVFVDGTVVMQQQGQGYVTCYINPKYDVRRTN